MFVKMDTPVAFRTLMDDIIETSANVGRRSIPAVRVMEDDQQTTIVAELPGVKKDDLKITFEDGVLSVSGSRKPYERPESARLLLNELHTREFRRTIRPAHDVEASEIEAHMADGVLTVILPKAERAKARTITVQ
jgi:HSP20 family protein